jgi:hypothetical protein
MSSRLEPASNGSSSDWAVQTADSIEHAVALVRDRATVPLRTVARAAVYGLALAVVSVVAVMLAVITALRALISYLPVGHGPAGQPRVWASYLILGGIVTIAGLLLLRKAEATTREGA